MQKKYAHMVATEGGFELNSIIARDTIVKAMLLLYRIGMADSECGILNPDSMPHILINLVTDEIELKDYQIEQLKLCAPGWATTAYNDGVNAKK